ncbi:MAG: MarR family transcriptional regulator [Actinomycetota bacterium]|nr:MarR family transcriptional regulator [Actinomycetota bacterium]
MVDLFARRIGFLFAKLHARWVGESISVLHEAGLGLSALHFGALSAIEAAGPMSQGALGELIGKDRTTMVAIVDELEARGLVDRGRNPADRRAYALEVTAAGTEWLEKALPLLAAAEDRLLTALDADERELLIALLGRVLFSPLAPPPPTAPAE